jgi:hypothetical protein
MRDLNRTFPNHVFFHQRQGPGQQSLFHVLRAYSAMDKQVIATACGCWLLLQLGTRLALYTSCDDMFPPCCLSAAGNNHIIVLAAYLPACLGSVLARIADALNAIAVLVLF